MNLEKLKEPFAPSDVSWRIGQAGKKQNGDIWAKVLAYIDNRNIQDRLDEVCGPEKWKNQYDKGPEGGVICGLSIKVGDEWITKWDGAENSDIEAVKGGLSDSMKRAAVQWGIGRYLYDLGENWAEIVDSRTQGAHYANCKVKVSGKEEYVSFHWLPPRNVLPEVAKARAVAAEVGMTTADKLAKPKEKSAYDLAIETIAKAEKDRDIPLLKKCEQRILDRHKEGVITEGDYIDLANKLADAEDRINAAADVAKSKKREPATA